MEVYKMKYGDEYSDTVELSTVLKIQNLQIALEQAVVDISQLQNNLAFVIRIKEEFESELKVKEKKEEVMIEECRNELINKDKEIQRLRQEQQEYADLLMDTKSSLQSCQTSLLQKEDEARRYNRIIEDQRSTIQQLHDEALSAKYCSDLSYQSISQESVKVQDLERQNDLLKFQAQKLKLNFQKQSAKTKKLQKELDSFKQWLGSVTGVRKVVEGCETILMEQISNRLNNCAKYSV